MTQDPNPAPNAERSRAALFRSLPLLIFTLCAVAAISGIALRNFAQFSASADMFDATAAVCGGTGSPQTAPYSPTPGLHPIVAFRLFDTGQLQVQNSFIPPEWLPATAAAAELVLCVGDERPAFRELCTGGTLVEYGREVAATLREARTGRIIQEGFISSIPNAPTGCVESVPENATDPDATVGEVQVQNWLRPFVTP